LVPDVEGILFAFPALFFGEIGDRSVEISLFGWLGGLVDESGRNVEVF
jgi:hypothetical protein